MKKFVAIMVIAGLVVGGFALVSAQAARPFPAVVKGTADGGKVSTTAAMADGFNYMTGFEPGEGFVPGYIKDQPCAAGLYCWGVTGNANRSLVEGHVDVIHPYAGVQHLRLSHDPTTRTNMANFGLGIDARIPEAADVVPQPVTKSTVSMMVAIDTPFGQDFIIQPQAPTQAKRISTTLFFYYGGIYVIDSGNYTPTGVNWDVTGAYQPYMHYMDPCNNVLRYYYGGVPGNPTLIWTGTDGIWAGTALEQILVFGDNFPGSSMDFDDIEAITYDYEPPVCGDGYISTLCGEQCEPTDDSNCPGRCNPADCQCAPICTLDDPCPLVNGENGPYYTSGGYYIYTSDTPFVSINACGSDLVTADSLVAIFDAASGGLITYNDDCNTDPYGAYADTAAPCYDATTPYATDSYNGCVCFPAGMQMTFIVWVPTYSQADPPVGSIEYVNVNKKIECNTVWENGACCDTNNFEGPQGCTDDVAPAACVGWDKVFTLNKVCAGVPCECIPNCQALGRVCGDDGCGGSCGTCDDLIACTDDACNNETGQCVFTPVDSRCDDGLFCKVGEYCDAATGCVFPGTPRNCSDGIACTTDGCDEDLNVCTHVANDGFCDDGLWCNGFEFCSLTLGCQDGADPCEADQVCDEEKDQCEPGTIPTVSTWGMVILALLLLTGAKVYFGRREVLA